MGFEQTVPPTTIAAVAADSPLELTYADAAPSADFDEFDRPILFAARAAAGAGALSILTSLARAFATRWWQNAELAGWISLANEVTVLVILLACMRAARPLAFLPNRGAKVRQCWAWAFAAIIACAMANSAASIVFVPTPAERAWVVPWTALTTASRHAYLLLVPVLVARERGVGMRRLLGLVLTVTGVMCLVPTVGTVISAALNATAKTPWYVALAQFYWRADVLIYFPQIPLFVAAVILATALAKSSVLAVRLGALIGVGATLSWTLYASHLFPYVWRVGWLFGLAAGLTAISGWVTQTTPFLLLGFFTFKFGHERFNALVDSAEG